jgi:hypothetical protein
MTKTVQLVIAALLPLSIGCVAADEASTVESPAVTTSAAALRYPGEGAASCTVAQVPSTEATCINHKNTSGVDNPAVITRVTGTGLPILDGDCDKELINFIYTDSAGKGGFVLGCTDTGTWTVDLCDPPPGTYSFVSRGSGKAANPTYTHFADCSAP